MSMEEDFEKSKEIFSLLVDSTEVTGVPVNSSFPQHPTHIQLCDRVDFSSELAQLSLQAKHQKVADECLKQLKLAGEVNIDQRIIMECVDCEINLSKKKAKMNDYSKASVKARLKEIEKSDQWSQAAVKEGGPRALQTVCVTQWNFCSPLSQHNLRKYIKTPSLKLAQVSKDNQSISSEMRCEVHSESAAIEEEEGNLEASSSHLQKASSMDNGTHQERSSSTFQLSQLRRSCYQRPACPEDKAALLMQKIRDMPSQQSTETRPISVSVGLLLAPDDFQILSDADDPSKSTGPVGSLGSEPVAELAARAQHHSICVERSNGYSDRQSKDREYTVRVNLWATLAKTARKHKVWDVCRASCRFTLLYDDVQRKKSEKIPGNKGRDESKGSGKSRTTTSHHGHRKKQKSVHLSRLLAEICFISAEATVLKSLEGVKLNSPAVAPPGEGESGTEQDPRWVVYRDWIQSSSAYATCCFLRGGEIGVEIGESWLVENAAIYLWNYNNHISAAGEYKILLPTFQNSSEMLQKMKDNENRTLCVMSCDAVARGLIQPSCERDTIEPAAASANSINTAKGETKQASSTHGVRVDPAALQGVQKASESCRYALCKSSSHITGDTIPIAVRKRMLATWVQIKRLLHQQIGSKLEISMDKQENLNSNSPQWDQEQLLEITCLSNMKCVSTHRVAVLCWTYLSPLQLDHMHNEFILHTSISNLCWRSTATPQTDVSHYQIDNTGRKELPWQGENEEVAAMSRVSVGSEMLQSNKNPKHMEFSVPSSSESAGMASECSWSDAVVELHVWCQSAAFCHDAKDHSLVLHCTQRALQSEEAAAKSSATTPFLLYGKTSVNEMSSTAACLRGSSLVYMSSGNLVSYREALKVFLSSVSFAETADSLELCVTAAEHFWNACSPSTQSPSDRQLLKEYSEKIPNALIYTSKNGNKPHEKKGSVTFKELPDRSHKHKATDSKALFSRAAINSSLASIHMDNENFAFSLKSSEEAINGMAHNEHRSPLLKHRISLKVRSGECIDLDMKMLQNESGEGCSSMWHQAASCAVSLNQQLSCYQNAITSLKSTEYHWEKVNLLLEFGGWSYCNNFPTSEARLQVQWAIDIILHLGPKQSTEPAVDERMQNNLKTEKHESLLGVHGQFTQNSSSSKEVRRLDQLIGAHTSLAIMAGRGLPEHKHNSLRAYTFVLQIWQVSIAAACEISSEMVKSQPIISPPSAGSKKSKDKSKHKKVKDIPTEERRNLSTTDERIPSTLREWTQYICPDSIRHIFRTNNSPHCINKNNFINKYQSSLYLRSSEKESRSSSLDHLTSPISHLAEIIAHDLSERNSLSDLYRLRIVSTSAESGFDSPSSYQEKLQSSSKIQEVEQMRCRRDMILSQEMRRLGKVSNQKAGSGERIFSGRSGEDVSSQDIWLEKAEVCLSMGLHQSARQLLAEAHMVSREFGDKSAEAKSLLGSAALACEEQHYAEAQILSDKAQTIKGDHDFWYQLTLIRVTAVVGQREHALDTKVDQIIKQGCKALQSIAELQVNRASELRSMMTSLEKRGAVECIRAVAEVTTAETFSTEVVHRLTAACDTLRVSASGLTKSNCRQQAAEAHRDCAYGSRLLGRKVTDAKEKQGYSLDGLSQMQSAVASQEHVALSVQSSFVPQVSCNSLSKPVRKLLDSQVCSVEFCSEILEERCAEQTLQALAPSKKTSTEIASEEFTRSSPQPDSTKAEWENRSRTLGQTVLSQSAAVNFQSLEDLETRARCLSSMGKYSRSSAVQEEPMYVRALWHKHKQESWSDSTNVPTAEEDSKKHSDSSRKEPAMTSAKTAESQRIDKTQQSLAEASQALSESISSCLQNNLPSTILAEASFNMLECHGQSDPAVTGQYLALYQSCCAVAMVAKVLSAACTDAFESQLSASLSFHKNSFLSQEKRPSTIPKDSPLNHFKACSQMTISPNHSSILSEIPPNSKFLLFQHSDDWSELYGGFYETTNAPKNPNEKTPQLTGPVTCSQVAKVSVSPQALVALREQTRIFDLEKKRSVSKEESGQSETSERMTRDTELTRRFREIVEKMEDYLNPLLSQFDFSFIRSQAAPPPVPKISKGKIKEEKCSSDKVEHREHLVILADRKLLELPSEALPLLQKEGSTSVSRDFSSQLFYSRLNREQTQKVESDNKKKTKGGKGTKGKGDQSQAIKVAPANHVLPAYTFAVDTSNFKYIVDPVGHFAERNRSSTAMKEVLEIHKQHLSHVWKDFLNSKEKPRVEQTSCRCSSFIYVGMNPSSTSIPPAKVVALNLAECRMASLFDRVQNTVDVLQSNNERQKSEGPLTLENPLETALLLSLSGVGCVVLNQWHSTLQQKTHDVAAVLDNVLRERQTSGQAIHASRGWECSDMPHQVSGTYAQELNTDSKKDKVQYTPSLTPTTYNCILYGLPNLIAS